MKTTIPAMRWLLVVASVLVLVIGVPLFLAPDRSDVLFSWTVNPPLTAAFLGAGYVSSSLLEYLSSRELLWVRARVAVPSVLVFTVTTLVVTLLHLDKFHFGSDFSMLTQTITWVWLVVYAAVPAIMAVLFVVQIRSSGANPPRVASMPPLLRRVLVVQAAVLVLAGIVLLIVPVWVAPLIWPWALSALTGRAIGAFLLGTAVVAAQSVWENDLVRVTGAMAAYCSFGFLPLFAVIRFAGADHPVTGNPVLDWGSAQVWVFVTFFVSLGLVGLLGLVAARGAKQSERAALDSAKVET